uniref:Uncharacterized protein n=1 Tax=Rhodococcoides fascians D188 TaxID=1051973 RepID=G8JZ47_RHOFA|nr:hypothetical protein pFi_182 [Rhodococcus fascians D188]
MSSAQQFTTGHCCCHVRDVEGRSINYAGWAILLQGYGAGLRNCVERRLPRLAANQLQTGLSSDAVRSGTWQARRARRGDAETETKGRSPAS